MRDYSLYRRFELPEDQRRSINLWINKLRKRRVEQGYNYLYNSDDGSFCAIGVYYDGIWVDLIDKIDFPAHLNKEDKIKEPLFQYVGGLNDGGNPYLEGDGYAQLSFAEIADFLESNVDFKN